MKQEMLQGLREISVFVIIHSNVAFSVIFGSSFVELKVREASTMTAVPSWPRCRNVLKSSAFPFH